MGNGSGSEVKPEPRKISDGRMRVFYSKTSRGRGGLRRKKKMREERGEGIIA